MKTEWSSSSPPLFLLALTVFTLLFSFSFSPFTSVLVPSLHTFSLPFSSSWFRHLPSSFSSIFSPFNSIHPSPFCSSMLYILLSSSLSSSSPYSLSYLSSPPLLHSSSPLCISAVIQFTCVLPFQILSPCITSEFLLGTPVDYLCARVSIHTCSYFLPAPAQIAAQDFSINNQALQAFDAGDIW